MTLALFSMHSPAGVKTVSRVVAAKACQRHCSQAVSLAARLNEVFPHSLSFDLFWPCGIFSFSCRFRMRKRLISILQFLVITQLKRIAVPSRRSQSDSFSFKTRDPLCAALVNELCSRVNNAAKPSGQPAEQQRVSLRCALFL